MKRGFFVLLIGLLLPSLFILNNVYFREETEFLSPIESEYLRIRYDDWGDGHFGAKRKNGRIHNGIDILAPVGTPVKAVKSGWAIKRLDEDGYGNYIKIYHGGNLMTLYAHLEDTNIWWIKKVRQGDVIGWTGRSGNAKYKGMKSHIHFEVRAKGVAVDPQKGYLNEPR